MNAHNTLNINAQEMTVELRALVMSFHAVLDGKMENNLFSGHLKNPHLLYKILSNDFDGVLPDDLTLSQVPKAALMFITKTLCGQKELPQFNAQGDLVGDNNKSVKGGYKNLTRLVTLYPTLLKDKEVHAGLKATLGVYNQCVNQAFKVVNRLENPSTLQSMFNGVRNVFIGDTEETDAYKFVKHSQKLEYFLNSQILTRNLKNGLN